MGKTYINLFTPNSKNLKKTNKKLSLLVLLINAPTCSNLIDRGVKILKRNKKRILLLQHQSIISRSPLRARKLCKDMTLKPFVPFNVFGNQSLNCDRTSLKEMFFTQIC